MPADGSRYEQGQTVTVLGNLGGLMKSGYTFSGWNTQPDGKGATYTESQTFSMGAGDVPLYAKWTANPTYAVSYQGNGNTGGTVPTDTVLYEQGQTVTVLPNAGNLLRTGYSFAGWNTQANGSGSAYTPTQTFPMGAADVTLYAMWTLNPTYLVTYDGNGNTSGAVPVDGMRYEAGATATVLGNTANLARSGYAFAGWSTQADGMGTQYAQGGSIVMSSSNITLYAKWNALVLPTVTSITPSRGYSDESTPNVQIQGTGFVPSTLISIGSVGVPSGNCQFNSSTAITCTIPAAPNTHGRFDVTADNGGGATGKLTSGWQYVARLYGAIPVLNGTGDAAEADFCQIITPQNYTGAAGTTALFSSRVIEADLTQAPGSSPSIQAYFAYGPQGSNPITQPNSWVWTNSSWVRQDGTIIDEYGANVTLPSAGVYSYAFVYLINRGSSFGYTFCDKDGAGAASAFSVDQLGVLLMN